MQNRIYPHFIEHLLGNLDRIDFHYVDDSPQTSQTRLITFKAAHLGDVMSPSDFIITSVLFNSTAQHIASPPITSDTTHHIGKRNVNGKKITADVSEDVHEEGCFSDVPGITCSGLPLKPKAQQIRSPSASVIGHLK